MANYPNSVPSFTNKSAGQTVASAHINSMQDEIVAIGSGLLNGTAQFNSSNSTVASLSILGGFTMFGRQNVTLSTGNTDNLSVQSSVTLLRVTGNSSGSTLTGFSVVGGNTGRMFFLLNASGNTWVLKFASGSVSSNQLGLKGGGDASMLTGQLAVVMYDDVTAAWRVSGI
jgi:hypothetical protein